MARVVCVIIPSYSLWADVDARGADRLDVELGNGGSSKLKHRWSGRSLRSKPPSSSAAALSQVKRPRRQLRTFWNWIRDRGLEQRRDCNQDGTGTGTSAETGLELELRRD